MGSLVHANCSAGTCKLDRCTHSAHACFVVRYPHQENAPSKPFHGGVGAKVGLRVGCENSGGIFDHYNGSGCVQSHFLKNVCRCRLLGYVNHTSRNIAFDIVIVKFRIAHVSPILSVDLHTQK